MKMWIAVGSLVLLGLWLVPMSPIPEKAKPNNVVLIHELPARGN
jgi:hypothetical protein